MEGHWNHVLLSWENDDKVIAKQVFLSHNFIFRLQRGNSNRFLFHPFKKYAEYFPLEVWTWCLVPFSDSDWLSWPSMMSCSGRDITFGTTTLIQVSPRSLHDSSNCSTDCIVRHCSWGKCLTMKSEKVINTVLEHLYLCVWQI